MAEVPKANVARRILIFDAAKKLVSIAQSQIKLAKMLGVKTPTVKAACDGSAISTCGYYLRWWAPEIEIDVINELGVLTLKDYDDLLGVNRRVYRDRRMTRKSLRLKYNLKKRNQQTQKIQRQ